MNDPDNTTPDTNDSGDPWESEMTAEFDRRVRDLHEAPLTLDTVKGKAVTIRRNRRAAVAGGILAAAAVIVPVAVLATDSPDQAAPRPDVASQSATDSSSPEPSGTASPTATSTYQKEPPAPGPDPSYLEGATLYQPDVVFVLPSATYESATMIGSRVVASARDDAGNVTVDVIDEDGAVVDSYAAVDAAAVDADRDVAAFVTTDGAVQTIWADGEAVLAEGYQGWSVRGVGGGPDCLDPEAGGSGCQVALVDQRKTSAPVVVDSHGLETNPVPDALDIRDADGGRYAVVDEITDDGTCGGVYDSELGDYAFTTCEYAIRQFSPDGSRVMATPANTDGFGPYSVSILDAATGTALATITSDDDSGLSRATWVDDDTIAVTRFSFAKQEWTLETLTAGGESAVVAGPAPGSDFEPPFGIVGG